MTNKTKFQAPRDKHREQYNDSQWADQQPKGPPNYKVGDIVAFHAGGFGVIKEVNPPQGGWPSSYAVSWVVGLHPLPRHPDGKVAWHYEGDFQLAETTRRQTKDEYILLLSLIADIRKAAGDDGKLMQDELVEHIRKLRADAELYRTTTAQFRADAEKWRAMVAQNNMRS